VPTPIILPITVLMTITAATSATCWTGLRPARATCPSHVPPFRSRDRRARDRDSAAPAIASAAIDATGVCMQSSLALGRANFELAWTPGEYPSLLAVEGK
jgi:hypothetical protein